MLMMFAQSAACIYDYMGIWPYILQKMHANAKRKIIDPSRCDNCKNYVQKSNI